MISCSQLSHSKVLITGADGMLGRAFQAILARDYPFTVVCACSHEQLDVTNRAAVLARISQEYDFIIHCAAEVNADRCEAFPERCYEVQVRGTLNVLELAAASRAMVFYPQSFLIFSGGDDLIDESSLPAPQSVYARCKLEAEQRILSAHVASLVVRMGGFFGGDEKDKNFVGKLTRHLVHLLRDGTRTYSVGDRVWQPTYTEDLARNSLVLIDRGQQGIWSMACIGEATFFDLARRCVSLLGFDSLIEIIPADKMHITAADIARRPERALISNERLISNGFCLQRPWEESLAEYLSRPWFKSLFSNIQ